MSIIDQLAEGWRQSGVKEGGTLLVHSSLRRTLGLHKGLSADDVLQSFLEALGPSGTLLLPAFNFDFNKGMPFDIRSTPSHMGGLTEAARARPDTHRSGHPVYSFLAIGKHAAAFGAINNQSGYGADSPFAVLRDLDGQIGVLGLPDQKSMTFYHHVEEMQAVPYRYHKVFDGQYTDAGGRQSVRRYGIFVRNIEEGVLTHVDPAGEAMWAAGLYAGDRPGEGTGFRTISANAMFNFVSKIVTEGRAEGLLYKREAPSS